MRKWFCILSFLLAAAVLDTSAQLCFEQAPPYPDSYILRYKYAYISLGTEDTLREEYTIYATGRNEEAFYSIYSKPLNIIDIRDSTGFYRYGYSNHILTEADVPDTTYLRNRVMRLVSTDHLRSMLAINPYTIDSISRKGYYIYKMDSVSAGNKVYGGNGSVIHTPIWFTTHAYYNCTKKIIEKYFNKYWMDGIETYNETELLSLETNIPGIYDSIRLDKQPIFIKKKTVFNPEYNTSKSEMMQWKNTKFPDFNLETISKGNLKLYRQTAKIYVIDFHYRSCPPCWALHNDLNKLQQKYPDGRLKIIGLNHKEAMNESTISFYNKRKTLYDVVFSNDKLKSQYKISAFPTVFILNKKFEIIDIIVGYSEQNVLKIESYIQGVSK